MKLNSTNKSPSRSSFLGVPVPQQMTVSSFMRALGLVGVVGAILASQVRCRKTSDSYLGRSKTLPLLIPCPPSVLRKPVRLRRRLRPVRESLQGPFGTNVLYPDSSDLLLFLQPTPIDVARSSHLFRRIHPPRDRQSWRQHRVGRTLSGSPPSALPVPTPPELCLSAGTSTEECARAPVARHCLRWFFIVCVFWFSLS